MRHQSVSADFLRSNNSLIRFPLGVNTCPAFASESICLSIAASRLLWISLDGVQIAVLSPFKSLRRFGSGVVGGRDVRVEGKLAGARDSKCVTRPGGALVVEVAFSGVPGGVVDVRG